MSRTWAALMTGPGAAALATLHIEGPGAFDVLRALFRPQGPPLDRQVGQVRVGTVVHGDHIIDQVSLAQEADESWVLHCHGNPLIAEALLQSLSERQVEIVSPERMARRLWSDAPILLQEALAALPRCRTRTGSRLLHAQTTAGLTHLARTWIAAPDPPQARHRAQAVLDRSRWVSACLTGLTVALVGPPNSGKSTLLNSWLGQPRVLVSDRQGTTRDQVEATITVEPLCLHLIDTAGLDRRLDAPLDRASQRKSRQALVQADWICVVLDGTRGTDQWRDLPGLLLRRRPVVTFINKEDLGGVLSPDDLPAELTHVRRCCARRAADAPIWTAHLLAALGLDALDPNEPIAFTERQRNLLGQALEVTDPGALQALAHRLLGDA